MPAVLPQGPGQVNRGPPHGRAGSSHRTDGGQPQRPSRVLPGFGSPSVKGRRGTCGFDFVPLLPQCGRTGRASVTRACETGGAEGTARPDGTSLHHTCRCSVTGKAGLLTKRDAWWPHQAPAESGRPRQLESEGRGLTREEAQNVHGVS